MTNTIPALLPDPTDSDALQRAVAATYENGVRILGDYQTVQRLAREENAGSVSAARAVGIDETTAESWLDKDGRPAPVRGLQRLEARGWHDLAWGEPPLTGLTSLVAWVFVRGRIAEWDPLFRVAGDDSLARLDTAAGAANAAVEQASDMAKTPDTYTAAADGWVLGRLLHALGAPLGPTTGQDLRLPEWLFDAPAETRERVARLYVSEVAFPAPDGDGLALHDQTGDTLATDLIRLFESVTDGDVWGPGWPIRLRGQAVADLQQDPTY